MQVELCWHVFNVCGKEDGLGLASQFTLYKTMTEMVHESGFRYYKNLYRHIDAGEYPLRQALRTVYACDKRHLDDVMAGQTHINTYNADYRGCKILEIFEQPAYVDELHAFLEQKNKALLAVSLARTKKCLNIASQILVTTVERSALLDT